jgi:hypothetical protein
MARKGTRKCFRVKIIPISRTGKRFFPGVGAFSIINAICISAERASGGGAGELFNVGNLFVINGRERERRAWSGGVKTDNFMHPHALSH